MSSAQGCATGVALANCCREALERKMRMKTSKFSLIVGMALLSLIVIATGCDDDPIERQRERERQRLREENERLRVILYVSIPSTILVGLLIGAWVGRKDV